MLGMVFGVAAVLTMVALGAGARASVEDEVRGAGANLVFVSAGNYTRGGDAVGLVSGLGSASTLMPEDAAAIAPRVLGGIRYVGPGVAARTQVVYGKRNWVPLYIYGTDAGVPRCPRLGRPGRGRRPSPTATSPAPRVVRPRARPWSTRALRLSRTPLARNVHVQDGVATGSSASRFSRKGRSDRLTGSSFHGRRFS